MIIDFHAHCFPDELAQKAIGSLSGSSGLRPATDGTVAGTDALMSARGIDRYVIANIAVSPRQENHVNSFAIRSMGAGRIPFGSVHPASPNAMDELSRLKDAGIRGVKLHNEYQGYAMDDPAAFPIYERCAQLGLIVLFHAGADIAFPNSDRAYPLRAKKIAGLFPGAKFVLAHFGGMEAWEDVFNELCGLPFYFDTSMSAGYIQRDMAIKLIRAHGPDKFLFGSDCPWQDPGDTARFIRSLGLSQKEQDAIFYENAVRLLGF